MSIGLVIILMVRVIPAFSSFYLQFDAELPLPTRIVMGLSTGLQEHFHCRDAGGGRSLLRRPDVAELALGATDHRSLEAQHPGGRASDASLRGVAVHPFTGRPARREERPWCRRCRPRRPRSATAIFRNSFAAVCRRCRRDVPCRTALDDTRKMPVLALAMMRVGESTGALPEMLEHTSGFFDEEIESISGASGDALRTHDSGCHGYHRCRDCCWRSTIRC